MAQSEDTELRDLVIEALERNGSLAKIRALLRANIFLAFEDECEHLKQNVNLDNILKVPEGTLALSIVHEFLEFCNLKNTLFVYMSESRQGNEYKYQGKKGLFERLNISKGDNTKEPILVTLMKIVSKLSQKRCHEQKGNNNLNKKCPDGNYRDEHNCTYIIHEDSQSSSASNSHSDNSSSDEKNKLHLRLHLDNSDTDTSSDSTRDKTSSEYIPGDHMIDKDSKNVLTVLIPQDSGDCIDSRIICDSVRHNQENMKPSYINELKLTAKSSSDSTSYIELKPFTSQDKKMLNTAGLPVVQENENNVNTNPQSVIHLQNKIQSSKVDSEKSGTLSSTSLISAVIENQKRKSSGKKSRESSKSDGETAEYSLDFTLSSVSKHQEKVDKHTKSKEYIQDNHQNYLNINSPVESPHQISHRSQSSISLSDIADLISENSYMNHHINNDTSNCKSNLSENILSNNKTNSKKNKLTSDHSGEFTESPVPSLSNLSLDIHSD